MNPKTIFFDLDGTLLGTKNGQKFQIPHSALRALSRLRENGHRIAVCSGRQEAFIHKFFPGLFQSYVAQNGAHVVVDGKTVLDRILPEERVKSLAKHFDSFGCGYVFLGKQHGWARNIPDRLFGSIEEIYSLPHFLIREWEPNQVKAGMMDFVFETDEEYKKCAGAFTGGMILNRHPGGLTSDLSFPEWDKGKGIGAFLSQAGIAKEDTVAFGDGYNDVSMMESVGCAVAMGNAVDKVKQKADYVTTPIFEDGIENGLQHLGLL
ncbi:MAG: Cof-type HAD-IIB family hydrolase [Oscillospiraceae bacterium]|jgi:Cof subfamily protein (haloacid dehalogenase superfamily)|nr:Cof-type HAD-IIB family hydrolase [Oscillospiraceae bacterium]